MCSSDLSVWNGRATGSNGGLMTTAFGTVGSALTAEPYLLFMF